MNWWQRLLSRKRMEAELEKELRFHVEQHTSDLMAQGLGAEEARRQAILALGGLDQVKEKCRDARGTRWVAEFIQDLHYAGRRLRGNPVFAAVCILTLALGIGASTAILSAVHTVLFEALPYPEAGRVVMIWDSYNNGKRLDVTFGSYRELAERSRSFQAVAVMRSWQPTLLGEAEPERLDGQRVSASYFQVLGVAPALGRNFEPSDDLLNGPKVAILSDGLWRRRFGGDAAIVGKPITLNGDTYTVIGIMPRGFENVLAPAAEAWTTLQYDMSQDRAWGHHLRMAARLRPDVDRERARHELNMIAQTVMQEYPRPPWASLQQGLIVNSLQDDITDDVKPVLLAILGAAMLLLAIACVNVTNLLLARGAQRRGEFAIRAALGAGRLRLIRQLLTETLLLAALGGGLGLMLAHLGISAFVALSPPGLPRADVIGIDSSVFAFSAGLTTLIGLMVGVMPALTLSRSQLHIGLQQSSRRTTGHHLMRRSFVVAEVALAFVLLVSAGLMMRSLQRFFAIAPGFETSELITMQVQLSGHRFDKESATHQFYSEALAAVRHLPGVRAAAFTSQLPISGDDQVYGVQFESSPTQKAEEGRGVFRYAVSPGYFETMDIPLRHGRLLTNQDLADAPRVALISESLARRSFPNEDALGQRLHVGPNTGPWYTIVGIVGDVKQRSLAEDWAEAVYLPTTQWHFADRVLWLVARADSDAAALVPSIKKAIWSVDKDQPIVRIATMEDRLAASAASRRFALILFQAFGLVALVLAATGIYGLLSGSVTEQIREIGVRLALGATRANILMMVFRQGLALTGLGLAIGLSAAMATSRLIFSLLFGISRLDPIAYLGVSLLLVAVSVMACLLPAWRAARVDPAITLRAE